jgi:hypothetical protein
LTGPGVLAGANRHKLATSTQCSGEAADKNYERLLCYK